MTREQYEQRKRRLEEQLRAGIQLLESAHQAQVRRSRCHPFRKIQGFPPLPAGGGDGRGGAGGEVLLAGATLYASFAVEDHRPDWPFDAADLIVQGRVHELTELHPGQLLQLVSIEHPTGGTPAWAEAYLLSRRP